MKSKETTKRRRILFIHENPDSLVSIIEVLKEREYDVVVVPDSASTVSQTSLNDYTVILMSLGLVRNNTFELVKKIKSYPYTSLTPVLVCAGREGLAEQSSEICLAGADTIVDFDRDPKVIADVIDAFSQRREWCQADPVTGLMSGAPLNRALMELCTASPVEWTFMAVKVLGLQSYNLGYGYDAGDDMMRDIGNLVREMVEEYCEKNDFTGRLYGPVFCVATRTRRVDSLCRNLLVRSERLIRKYYSPFELMKGYMTIEENGKSEHYYLCELNIGAIVIPARWDGHVSYMLDLSGELLESVKREGIGYRVLTP